MGKVTREYAHTLEASVKRGQGLNSLRKIKLDRGKRTYLKKDKGYGKGGEEETSALTIITKGGKKKRTLHPP